MRTSSSPFRKFLRSCLLFLPLLALTAGCGSKGGTVSGKVSYKGKPLTTGIVNFFPEAKSGNYVSSITSDGSYSISNLPPGPARISVVVASSKPPEGGGAHNPMAGERIAKGMEQQKEMMRSMMKGGEKTSANTAEAVKIPEKYGDPETSGLKIDVKGGKQAHNIELE